MPGLKREILIPSAARRVWEVLADFGGVSKWAPMIAESHMTEEGLARTDSRRLVTLAAGFVLDERVSEWDEGHGFTCEVCGGIWPIRSVKEQWRLT